MSTKICRNCKNEKDISEFPFFSTSDAGRKNTCKCCNNELSSLRRNLRCQNPPPIPGNCPICNNYTTTWILDHCHFDNVFRGYICNSCNLGIGRFNDDVNILHKAIEYLNKNTIIEYHI
jgi:hypothetical protein